MSDLVRGMAAAAAGMEAQTRRLRHVTENIANADTPGYRRKLVAFRADGEGGTIRPSAPHLDPRPVQRIFEPHHPLADETGHRDGSNVDLVVEIADARQAQRSYEANLRMFDQARQMTQSLLDLLRR